MAKKAKTETEGDKAAAERTSSIMGLAMDPATLTTPMTRNPAMENTIRQGIQSGLFFAALAARYTATTEDDKAVARALAVTMDPEKWKVIADLIWGA